MQIHFHTLRYWKGTMEYRKYPSLLHVMAILGHKSFMLYVQLAETSGSDEFICEVARTLPQATKLVEGGLEYVAEMDGCKIFRKRK
jgi:hypothetical protein